MFSPSFSAPLSEGHNGDRGVPVADEGAVPAAAATAVHGCVGRTRPKGKNLLKFYTDFLQTQLFCSSPTGCWKCYCEGRGRRRETQEWERKQRGRRLILRRRRHQLQRVHQARIQLKETVCNGLKLKIKPTLFNVVAR